VDKAGGNRNKSVSFLNEGFIQSINQSAVIKQQLNKQQQQHIVWVSEEQQQQQKQQQLMR